MLRVFENRILREVFGPEGGGCERSVVMTVVICATAKQSAVGAVCRTNVNKMGAARSLGGNCRKEGRKICACVCVGGGIKFRRA